MPAIVIIPARYASSRFPGKPLCLLFNKPLIQHVYERVRTAGLVDKVFVATDDDRIYAAVKDFGGCAIMTSSSHQSGTDRLAETIMKLQETEDAVPDKGIVVNVQGDEPMIMPDMVDETIRLMDDKRASIGTLMKRIEDVSDITNPNVVKVVCDREGFALYFSRAPIPYHRDLFGEACWKADRTEEKINASGLSMFKHIGIYAYRKDVLLSFSRLAPSALEGIERLEQLRAIENGLSIKVRETMYETIGVDSPEDLERVEKCLSLSS